MVRFLALAFATLALALPLASAHAGKPQVMMGAGGELDMADGALSGAIYMSLDFASGKSGDKTCYLVSAKVAVPALDALDVEFRPYTHCPGESDSVDRWGYVPVNITRELRFSKDLKIRVGLLGFEGTVNSNLSDATELFFGIIHNVLGVQLLRASAQNMGVLQLDAGKAFLGVSHRFDSKRVFRATLGFGADIGVVATGDHAWDLTGDAEVSARLGLIFRERSREIEAFVQATAATLFIGTDSETSSSVLDLLFGFEARI